MADGSYSGDLELAQRAWELFHAKKNPPKNISLKGKARDWPRSWGFGGQAVTVYYSSDKWKENGDYINYYHDHGGGIGLWLPSGDESWLQQKTLPLRKFPQAVSVLGYFLGVDYERAGGKKLFRATPEDGEELLCCFPDRKHLVVVHPNRGAAALIFGPGLIVEARGVVG